MATGLDAFACRRCHVARLHFLHGSAWAKSGQKLGEYVVTYADGEKSSLDVIEGTHVHDWYWGAMTLPDARPAWIGRAKAREGVALYRTIWENPRPDVTVASLDIVSGTVGPMMAGVLPKGILGVLAVTAERAVVGPPVPQVILTDFESGPAPGAYLKTSGGSPAEGHHAVFTAENCTDGKRALRLTVPTQGHPGALFAAKSGTLSRTDWRGAGSLAMDVHDPQEYPLRLQINTSDADYSNWWSSVVVPALSVHTVRLSLTTLAGTRKPNRWVKGKLQNEPLGAMDLKRIARLSLYFNPPIPSVTDDAGRAVGPTFTVDRVRLENVRR